MLPNVGSKKKDSASRMDRQLDDLPKLSNEMQLSIMNRVKNGELSIEDALNQARRDRDRLLKQRSPGEEEQKPSQYNFSVHKHGRYRWQKRVLQIDFNTKMLCSIEKGIIKRQLPFSVVKSCDDGVGSRFSISFKEHHDYELEATAPEDKHKMMQLVNQIIYGNIYSDGEEGAAVAEAGQQPPAPRSLREGVLFLHRGGLASFRWVKYEVQLHQGQLTLAPLRCRGPAEGEVTTASSVSTVIHLSDGDTSVQKPPSPDAFTLITHKNQYQFKVPVSDQTSARGAVQRERDAWVSAIDNLCADWKRRSRGEHVFVGTNILRNISIAEDTGDAGDTGDAEVAGDTEEGGDTEVAGDTEDTGDAEDRGDTDTDVKSEVCPPASADLGSSSGGQSPAGSPQAVPEPCIPAEAAAPDISPRDPPSSSPACPQPPHAPLTPAPTGPGSPEKGSGSTDARGPAPPRIPPPPPLLVKTKNPRRKPCTKAFHWDLLGPDRVAKSFWTKGNSRQIDIDTSRLFEQFAVKDLGMLEATELTNNQLHIMLNKKIAHNFNIFLKSFPVQPGELKDKLFIVHEKDGGLSDGHIASLRRYVPTADDVEMYKSHKGPVTELHVVDQYMMEMCNIPFLSKQLDLLLTLRELPVSMSDLQPLINQKIRMCTQLSHCRSFVSVLEYVLAIGNYLNESAGKEKAKGFRLSSLTKLSQLRGRDRTFTLVHALVEQIMLHEPGLATFTQDLAEFETVPGASIKGLTAEVDVLKNELQKVIQYRKTSKKRNAETHHPVFTKDLKTAIEKYDAALSALTKTCEEMKKLYSVILVRFGEPADRDSQEVFGLIGQFVHDFKTAHAQSL